VGVCMGGWVCMCVCVCRSNYDVIRREFVQVVLTRRLEGLRVCVHTGVPQVLITGHMQAVRHSGCTERSFRTRSNGQDKVHGLLSSLDAGQRVRETLSWSN
jgi:hypothetical protein